MASRADQTRHKQERPFSFVFETSGRLKRPRKIQPIMSIYIYGCGERAHLQGDRRMQENKAGPGEERAKVRERAGLALHVEKSHDLYKKKTVVLDCQDYWLRVK